MITKEQIATDKALCNNATKGPWVAEIGRNGPGATVCHKEAIITEYYPNRIVVSRSVCNHAATTGKQYEGNMDFIAKSRTLLPEYIAEVERLQNKLLIMSKQAFIDAIHEYCEAAWCASWIPGIEFELYDLWKNRVESNNFMVGLYRKLDVLVEDVGGWLCDRDTMTIIPLERLENELDTVKAEIKGLTGK